ncbi:MAG TPA: AsmA family protein [Caulobacteraceae bacterium]
MQQPLRALHGEPIASPSPPPRSRAARRWPHWGAVAGGLFLGALILFLLLFQWNWLRGPLAHAISGRIHRPVTIAGNLEVHPWSLLPTVTINDMTIGEPAWAGKGAMARLPRLTVRIELLPLLRGQTLLALVAADRPQVVLISDGPGRANWNFSGRTGPVRQRFPAIGRLVISNGALRFTDLHRRISFQGAIATDERASPTDLGMTTISGGLVVANPPWAGAGDLARAPRFTIATKLIPAMRGKLVLSRVEADRPDIRLVRDVSGRENWNFNNDKKPKPLKLPPINHLVISNGALRYDDAKRGLHFEGVVSSNEQVAGAGRGVFELSGKGVLNKAPFLAQVTGGPLVNVDKNRPYRFDARVQTGTSRLQILGIILHPFDFARLSGTLRVSGQDFADLYPLTGLALPTTPPYEMAGGFSRVAAYYALRGLHGRVGDSDLAGAMSVDDTRGRPFVTAKFASRRLRIADLAAVIGGAPRRTAGHTMSPAQKIIAAKLRAEHRFLPDTRLQVNRVRGMDARLDYNAQSVEAGRLPIRSLALKLSLDHGVLNIDPLSMSLPQGRLSGLIRIDARRDVPVTSMDMRVSNARLEQLVGRGGANPPLEGGLYARAKLTGTGDSVRAAAASANGLFTVVIPGGEIRQAFAELLGIDATKGLFLLISKNQGETPIRCAVADFRARNGILTAQRIVLDTGVVLATGSGQVDLRDETLNLRLSGKPKKFRLVRIDAPITVKGRLEAPKFGVDVGKAAGQLVLSGLLGALVSPLAVILPFVSPGLAHNADCAALTAAAAGEGAPVAAHARH